jgi:hypothetical protein
MVTAISVFAGLTISNFLWQVMTSKKNWGEATKRSFFQAIDLGTYLLVS